ncbi:MAG: hypothetical protein IKL24_05460 [Clostridia bacterium]|nr:hypothetical protein [Clostridia bacterium]
MKKILSAVLCLVLLVSAFSVTSFAASEGEVKFSMRGGEGKAGDIVTVEVYLDENPGTWACLFQVRFNERNFILLSVENGEVYTDGEWVKSVLTNRGRYIYYAEGNSPTQNVTKTGKILTLTFEITERAPVGDNNITLFFPDNGYGWFFDATLFPDVVSNYTVSCTNSAVVNVLPTEDAGVTPDTDEGTDSTEPDTDELDTDTLEPGTDTLEPGTDTFEPGTDTAEPDDTTTADPEPETEPGKPVTDVVTDDVGDTSYVPVTDEDGNEIYWVTDDIGEVVTDENGDAETTVVPPSSEDGTTPPVTEPGIPVTELVFDSDGNIVTDENGERVTSHVLDPNGDLAYYVTDENGDVMTYPDGEDVLTVVPPMLEESPEAEETTGEPVTIAPETQAPAPDTTTKAPADTEAAKEPVPPVSPYKIILIASLAAVVVGAIIVIIVMTKPKKDEE